MLGEVKDFSGGGGATEGVADLCEGTQNTTMTCVCVCVCVCLCVFRPFYTAKLVRSRFHRDVFRIICILPNVFIFS